LSVLASGGVCAFVNEKSTFGKKISFMIVITFSQSIYILDELQKIQQKTNFKYLICGKENEKIASELATDIPKIKVSFNICTHFKLFTFNFGSITN